MKALFPCASITGAPKPQTMKIISEVESTPRGLYTGAVGFIAPSEKSQFNVAIRTVFIDKTTGIAEYGVDAKPFQHKSIKQCVPTTKVFRTTNRQPTFLRTPL